MQVVKKNYIMPRRILASEGLENAERIFEAKTSQLLCSLDSKKECILLRKGGYILIDFGVELCGGIEISIDNIEETVQSPKCRIVFGESVTEAMSNLGEKNSGNYHTIRDMTVDVVRWSTNIFGDTGFRFVKIEAKDVDMYIKTLRAVSFTDRLEYKGSFECSDPKLNNIWRTGAYTVELCTNDYIWDGVKRDRLVWVGDMHPEVSTVSAVFGDHPSIRNSLDFAKKSTPIGEWMNKTATYSMWWIIIHHDYFMHWGDYEYLAEQEEYLIPLCESIIEWANEDFAGAHNEMKGFVDWSSKYSDSEYEGRWAIGCISLNAAAKIFKYLKNEKYEKLCRDCLARIVKVKPYGETNKSVSALTVLSGRDTSYAEKVISGVSPEDMSCFMGYYVLKAKAMLGQYEESLELIKKYWGAMIDVGATTFWEDFDVEWLKGSGRIDQITPDGLKNIHGDFGKHCYEELRLSLCHGWSGGPTPYLMEQIGGIEILEPGCKRVRISPKLSGLEWMKIEYPTPYGSISVYSYKNGNDVVTEIDAPEAIIIEKN